MDSFVAMIISCDTSTTGHNKIMVYIDIKEAMNKLDRLNALDRVYLLRGR